LEGIETPQIPDRAMPSKQFFGQLKMRDSQADNRNSPSRHVTAKSSYELVEFRQRQHAGSHFLREHGVHLHNGEA